MSARAMSSTTPNDAPPARAIAPPTSSAEAPARDALLEQIRLLGRTLDDLERMRVMGGNRVAAFERELGLKMDYHDVIQKQLRVAEHIAELELKRAWRKHPLAPWALSVRGVGEKSIARLIAEIGDPAERPNPGKLLAYCGHGEALRRHHKGMSQDELFRCGNPRAKKQVWLIATAMLKTGNRDLYDARRAVTAETHPDWTAGHSHADALRIVGKRFLIDLWVAARADQPCSETQEIYVRAGLRPTDAHSTSAPADGNV
jgi:transposase